MQQDKHIALFSTTTAMISILQFGNLCCRSIKKRIREWKKTKIELLQIVDNKDAKRKRMEGAGRKVISEDLDRSLIQWVFSMRRRSLRVSRKMIRRKATEMFGDVQDATRATFKASRGWLEKFMKRSNLSLRRRTTAAQKTPDMMVDKIVSFIRFMERARERIKAKP
jgi:hypothetical protein